MKIINSQKIRDEKIEELKKVVKSLVTNPKLAIVQVEGDKASNLYVNNKVKLGEVVGVKVEVFKFPNYAEQKEVVDCVKKLNKDDSVSGIIVQLPLPKHMNKDEITNSILFSKDVDGLSEKQIGMLARKNPLALRPCTALGVVTILKAVSSLDGKDVTIVNRSDLIGKPLTTMLTNENCTTTLCHSKTLNLKDKIRRADIVVTGIGKPEMLDKSYFRDGQIIIDCSMNFKDGRLCGDVDVESVKDLDVIVASGKGHTGPMTVLSLISNTIQSAYLDAKAQQNDVKVGKILQSLNK